MKKNSTHDTKPRRNKPKATTEVCPDGVPVHVNWDAFEIGTSVFIPALDFQRLRSHMHNAALRRSITLRGLERIEGGKLGMRFWRIL